jgi:hypothetical protein
MERLGPVLRHIREVFANDHPESYEYMLNWMARIIQKPQEKNGTVLHIRSEQGTGKNLFWEWFGHHVLGSNYFKVFDRIDYLLNTFNSPLENKLLVLCDELGTHSAGFYNNNALKSIITRNDVEITRKGMEPKTEKDYANYVMITNNEETMRVEDTDRRYAMFEANNKYRQNAEYITTLKACLDHPETAPAFFAFLAQRDISQYVPRLIPETAERTAAKITSAGDSIQFYLDVARGLEMPERMGPFEAEDEMTFSDLFQRFSSWRSRQPHRIGKPNQRDFTRQTNELLGEPKRIVREINGVKDRPRMYTISRKIIRNALAAHYKCDPSAIHDE